MRPDLSSLPPRPPLGARVIRLEVVPSTSDVAKQLLRAGEAHGTVVVAAEQTSGRGQRGRRWASPRGGLWASLLTRPRGLPATRAGVLNLAAAVAAAEAAASAGAAVTLKWPNDLVVDDRKVGGVLVETAAAGDNLRWAVIGVGINANVPRDALPPRLRAVATSLHEAAGRDIPLDQLLRELCHSMQKLLEQLESGADGEILRRWRALDTTPGRLVRTWSDGLARGRVQGIDDQGRLLIDSAGGILVATSSHGLVIE
ncbi:MAG TPA: biotin--[acetyl-CoA-carboxylase] ligase [Armatimonadota bacterium]|nr:biotin--[acetyl-CoA-carboxylase] ligase [Armatimonadota bacterium]